MLGSDAPAYYQSARALTRENAKAVLDCLAADAARAVARIVEISVSGRAPKQDPAIFALALATLEEKSETRALAYAAVPKVCRTATHLFQFVATAKALGKGFGRGMKRAVAAWYDDKPVEAIAYQAIKYRSREGYDHERLLDMASSPLPEKRWRLATSVANPFTCDDHRPEMGITDEEFRKERRDAKTAAKAFSDACASGDIERFYEAVHALHLTGDVWRLAMLRVARLPGVSEAIHAAFLRVWIETKMLPLVVGNRRVLAEALRVLFPPPKCERPIRLYRGARAFERRRHIYGFSWTTRVETARHFADRWRESGDSGVVLETLAPPTAVLVEREETDGYYSEGEVVVDPFKLSTVAVVERLPSLNRPRPDAAAQQQ